MIKTALVTGANRGIGKEIVRQLLDKGYKVILTARSEEKAKKACEDLGNPEHLYHTRLDATDQNSVDEAEGFTYETFGYLNVLVNNAAINYDSGKTPSITDINYAKETFDTNFFGVWRVCNAFIPLLKKADYGNIVNVSSGAGSLHGMSSNVPAYGTSKAALNALTIKLADELKSNNILVNAGGPGWVRTDMGGDNAPRSIEEGAASIVWIAELEAGGPTGKFFRDGKEVGW